MSNPTAGDILQAARDWAQDARFDPDHTYITGMPWQDNPEANAATQVVVEVFSTLSDAQLKQLDVA